MRTFVEFELRPLREILRPAPDQLERARVKLKPEHLVRIVREPKSIRDGEVFHRVFKDLISHPDVPGDWTITD
jgi:hypothetical protein